MKKYLGMFIIIFILAGCLPFGSGAPDGFSKTSHEDLVKTYRSYEKAKIENNRFDSDREILFDYLKKADKGELTEQEEFVRDSISRLAIAYTNAYNGLNNESYGITELVYDTLTAEIGTMKIEEIRKVENQVLSLLELEPLTPDKKDEEMKRRVHEAAVSRIMRATGAGEKATPATFEDSFVVFRKDRNEYYVASSFSHNENVFKFDMILDSDLNILDVYVAGVNNELFSKPMNDDNRPKWLADIQTDGESEKNNVTAKSEIPPDNPDDAKTENEESSSTEGIYGSEKEAAEAEDGVQTDGSSETFSEEANLPDWDKELFLGGTISDIAAALETLRQINADAMSMGIDTDYANEMIMTVSYLRDNLSYMLLDPATSPHLTDSEKESMQMILNGLDAAIEAEQQMINDPSTQNIRTADSTTEEVQGIVYGAQFN